MKQGKPSDISKPVMTLIETGAGYRITQVGDFDYADHFEGYHDDKPRRPRELVVEIILPGVPSPSDIDAEVNTKSVAVKAPGVFRGVSVRHDFSIPLPFEVLTNVEYSASFAEQVLTLRLKVKPEKVQRIPFQVKEEPPSDHESDPEPEDDQHEIVEALAEVQAAALKQPTEKVVKQAKFSLTTEERVVTVVLYVPRALEDTLRISGNHISVDTRDGQTYECDINPPFPLQSVPVTRTNPVTMYLIFVEGNKPQDEPAPAQEAAPEPADDISGELQNPHIFELDMN